MQAYAFDLANFAGFFADRSLGLGEVAPTNLFDYLDWQSSQVTRSGPADQNTPSAFSLATILRASVFPDPNSRASVGIRGLRLA